MGNRARVLDRWYGRNNRRSGWRAAKTPRGAFTGVPQYKFEDLYISPLTHKRSADADGNIIYVPIEPARNMTPTGIKVMDNYLQHLARGESDVTEFCKQYNARTSDIDGMVFLLTGMSNQAFRAKWQIHTADLLLRYTDMGVAEVARRSGMGTRTNMYFIYERELDTSPTERRNALRQKGDVGRYAPSQPPRGEE